MSKAVFGDTGVERPVCHRAVKRKLIGALHEETLFGPVLDRAGKFSGNYTGRKNVLALTPNHLRVPDGWDERSAMLDDSSINRERKAGIRAELAAMADPPPGKSGIVRDRSLPRLHPQVSAQPWNRPGCFYRDADQEAVPA